MVSRRTGFLALFVAILVPASLPAQTPERDAERANRVRVRGIVLDRLTGEPLSAVSVQIQSESLPGGVDQMTNDQGRFAFPTVRPGVYDIRIVRIGYQTLEHTVELAPRTELTVEVELTPEAFELEPIVVETTRQSALVRTGFFERQERGFGRFVTRDEIEARNSIYVSDVLRTLAGVHVTSASIGGSRGIVTLGAGCRAEIFVDGVRMRPPFGVDDFLSAEDVEAIEVYRGIEGPPDYSEGSCGSVVVWTRRGAGDNGRPFTWTRLFMLVGLVTAGLLFVR